ncbi:hypothetical protein Calag_0396 [Caldisphaera lagunensis DSM 15908]|uniref:Uncharacterized protein n=1 Tax=Caldisphaera lagunensis (strain DSM 15908 / JCM 11604 / ANMR 0165 / IC-154) TaxID=1056495 RepID=L0AAN3_CALLD|nr:hypothetical protein [Caldisphaera lagunensis]AFZ70167.1 hypothetical protein Calag_0396 [Caldisphaera lagunensis DSM 15908]
MSEKIPAGGPYKAAIGIHEQLNADDIKDSRRLWSTYCTNDLELCKKFYDIIINISNLIAEARIEDIDSSTYQGIDKDFLNIMNSIKNNYSLYLSGSIISFGEFVLVKFNRGISLPNGKFIEKNEISLIPLEEAILLSSLKYVDPVTTLSYSIINKQKKD